MISQYPSRCLLFLLLAALCIQQSVAAPPVTERQQQAITTLFAGDTDVQSWRKGSTDFDVLYPHSANKGVRGTTCQEWTQRIGKWLTKYNPTTVVLVCGAHDLGRGASPAEVFGDVQKIVAKIAATGAQTVFLGTKPEPNTKDLHGTYQEFDALVRDHYERSSPQDEDEDEKKMLTMIDVHRSFLTMGNPRSLYALDRVHLSAEGYGHWNAWLQTTLEDESGCRRWESGNCVIDADGGATSIDIDIAGATEVSVCVDDAVFRYQGKKAQDCAWVGKDASNRCTTKHYKGKTLSEWCPEACGDC